MVNLGNYRAKMTSAVVGIGIALFVPLAFALPVDGANPMMPINRASPSEAYQSLISCAKRLEESYGIVMPRRMQVEFSAIVQALANASETDPTTEQIWEAFKRRYLAPEREQPGYIYRSRRLFEHADEHGIRLELANTDGNVMTFEGTDNGPIAATVAALGLPLRIDSYEERSLGVGSDAMALANGGAAIAGVPGVHFGVGRHANIATASVLAVLSATARFSVKVPAVS